MLAALAPAHRGELPDARPLAGHRLAHRPAQVVAATVARSSSARAGVVIGMLSSRMSSIGMRDRWIATPGIRRGSRSAS